MWFKNLLIYSFTKPFTLDADQLETQLLEKPFKSCGSQDAASRGWAAPISEDGAPLVHGAHGRLMLCLQRQEKVLPAAVVNEAVEAKVTAIKTQESRHVGRKERVEIKEQAVFEMLPRAFAKSNRIYGYIDPAAGLLVINTSSGTQAEEFMNTLRESLGSLPVVPLKPLNPIPDCMTHWLKASQAPEQFTIGGECELRDKSDASAVIRCKNLDLQAAEIISHIDSGMYVNKLEVNWNGGIECVVDDKFAIKRLKFDDLITDKLDDVDAESAAEQFDVDFVLMASEFSNFIPALVNAFGGPDSQP
jgi:recombination associated protein RdgC